jgi:hypothetical protein
MLLFGSINGRRQKLVLVACGAYLFFSCFYVTLCQRDTRMISLFSRVVSATQQSHVAVNRHTPSSVKFLSRPRVIVNKITKIYFAALRAVFIFYSAAHFLYQKKNVWPPRGSYYFAPPLCRLQAWRI